MGKGKNVTVGFKYYMGIHMGTGRGPVDELCEVTVGDRQAWQGSVTDNTQIRIKKPDLFGGTKAEGGIDGTLDVMMGGASQTMSSKLRDMLTGSQPQFRGVLSLFFDGMVCAMSPYPKPWKFRVRRILSGWDGGAWYPTKATIELTGYYGDGTSRTVKAMNPVHIIYEALTNRAWGLGRDRSLFLDADWRKAADQVFDEKFGLCMRWGRQDTLMSFIQSVIDHIGCAVYVDKFTGKFTIKLIRNDYDADSLPVVGLDSGLLKIDEATNASIYNLINEIVVTGHNPVTNETITQRAHNLALIQTQGAINSDTRDYPGLPTHELCNVIAQRDLKAASTNVRRFTLVVDRRLWHIQPAAVFKINEASARGIETVIVRVGTVEESGRPDGSIKITAVQDVFGVELNTFTDVQPPEHQEPDFTPAIARRLIYEAPYAELLRAFPEADFNTIKPVEGFIDAHAERPTPVSMAYDLAVRPEGQADFVVNGNGDFVPLAELAQQVSYLDTTFRYYKEVDLDEDEIEIGDYMVIATTEGTSLEFVRLDDWDPVSKFFTVARGCFDTIPQRHFADSLIWMVKDLMGGDLTRYISGETVEMKILPWTMKGGRFPIDDAPVDELTFRSRFYRPYAPGLVTWETMQLGSLRWYEGQDLRYDVGPDEVPDSITIKWAHRDRVLQQDQVVDHMQTSIGPEPGQTYRLRFYNAEGVLVRTETGITGTQYVYTYGQASIDTGVEAGTPEATSGVVYLDSMRDGVASWMYYTLTFTIHKKPPQTANVAALAMQTTAEDTEIGTGEDSTENANVALMLESVSQSDSDIIDPSNDPSGGQVAMMSKSVSQATKMVPLIDFYLYEAPYLSLVRDGRNLESSQMFGFVARPSDRLTDGFDFFSRLEGETSWQDQGSQPWTPWGTLGGFMDYLTNEFDVNETSDTDGVPINSVQQGDIILIDNELMVVNAVNGKRFTVGRGVADTIPAVHYSRVVVWLFDRAHAASNRLFGDNDKAQAVIRPHALDMAIQPEDMPAKTLQLQYRPRRPYPPGLLLANGLHWYNRVNACADNFDPTNPKGKDVVLTWAHRNRIWQDDTAYDHFASGISPEPGVQYRVWVGYTAVSNTSSSEVTLATFLTSDAGITLRKADIERWGLTVGRYQKSGGQAALRVAVNAIRDNLPNWQGYGMTFIAPSYPLPPGEVPILPPEPNHPDPGTDTPNPNNPNPGTPGDGGDGGTTDPTPDPENPNPNPDPEVPDTDPPEPEPEPEPDPDNVFGWSNNWDHGWAAALPDQSGDN